MELRISHTWPKIGIQTQNAKINLSNSGKLDCKISHSEPQISITSTQPKVYIDQKQCFADAGLKGIDDFAAEYVQLGKNAVMQYIQREAQQGDSFAKIKPGSKPEIDAIADEVTRTVDYNIGLIPEHPPAIDVEEGTVDIELIEGRVNVEYNNVPIESEYIPYQIQVYLEQEAKLEIEFVGNNIDTKV